MRNACLIRHVSLFFVFCMQRYVESIIVTCKIRSLVPKNVTLKQLFGDKNDFLYTSETSNCNFASDLKQIINPKT